MSPSITPSNDDNKLRIRKTIRAHRRALSPWRQQKNAHALVRPLFSWARSVGLFQKNNRVAIYLAADGEINLLPIINRLKKYGCRLYQPRWQQSSKPSRLTFHQIQAKHTAHKKISRSLTGKIISVKKIHTVLVPLVAFDRCGNRLGRGGGYYDYTFAHKSAQTRLLGIAHDCQQSEQLAQEKHDIAMHTIITPSKKYHPSLY